MKLVPFWVISLTTEPLPILARTKGRIFSTGLYSFSRKMASFFFHSWQHLPISGLTQFTQVSNRPDQSAESCAELPVCGSTYHVDVHWKKKRQKKKRQKKKRWKKKRWKKKKNKEKWFDTQDDVVQSCRWVFNPMN